MNCVKRPLLIVVLIILCFFMTGCIPSKIPKMAKIAPPSNYEIPLKGDWTITNTYKIDNDSIDVNKSKDYIGKKIFIDKEKVTLLDKECVQPEFKIKTVDSRSYLVSKYGINPELLDIYQSEFQIITVTQKDNYFASFIMLNDNNILTYINGLFCSLIPKEALKDTLSEGYLVEEAMSNSDIRGKVITSEKMLNSSEIIRQSSSGLLLGLKSYDKNDANVKMPLYRTLWINFDTSFKKPTIKELPYILVPRKSGFWALNIGNEYKQAYFDSKIFVYPIDKNIATNSKESAIINGGQAYEGADISFVGNDYISLELDKNHYNNHNYNFDDRLIRIYALDTINNKSSYPILISNIFGEYGIKALKQGASSHLNSLNYNLRQKLEQAPNNYSFGLIRNNGKWVLRGRLNALNKLSQDETSAFTPLWLGDFNIPLIPSADFVGYDSLYPSWSIIKHAVPEALDAFSSPSRNFVVVITKTSLIIYNIVGGDLETNPLLIYNLKTDEKPIMSQWSTGNYVKTWDEQIDKLAK